MGARTEYMKIGNAEVLNLENREVRSEQREQSPGGQEDTGRGHFHRGDRFRHSTIGTQWQPQSIDIGVSTMAEQEIRRSHSEQDLVTRQRQQQLARAAEFYTAVG